MLLEATYDAELPPQVCFELRARNWAAKAPQRRAHAGFRSGGGASQGAERQGQRRESDLAQFLDLRRSLRGHAGHSGLFRAR
eukprot:scaffold3071_cov253-Pinguiococcus_pyrenoidosus.AAC.8